MKSIAEIKAEFAAVSADQAEALLCSMQMINGQALQS